MMDNLTVDSAEVKNGSGDAYDTRTDWAAGCLSTAKCDDYKFDAEELLAILGERAVAGRREPECEWEGGSV